MNADFLDVPTRAALAASAAGHAASTPLSAGVNGQAHTLLSAQGGAQMQAISSDWLRGLPSILAQASERSAQAAAALQQAWQQGEAHFAWAFWNIAVPWGGDAALRDLLLLLLALLLAGWWLRRRGAHRAARPGVRRKPSRASRATGVAAGASRVGAAGAMGAAAFGLDASSLAASAWDDDDDYWLGAEATPGEPFPCATFNVVDPIGVGSGGAINPATGRPMIGGDCTGVDIAGNPCGVDAQAGEMHASSISSASTVASAFSDIGGDRDGASVWERSSSWHIGSSWDDDFCSSTSSWD